MSKCRRIDRLRRCSSIEGGVGSEQATGNKVAKTLSCSPQPFWRQTIIISLCCGTCNFQQWPYDLHGARHLQLSPIDIATYHGTYINTSHLSSKSSFSPPYLCTKPWELPRNPISISIYFVLSSYNERVLFRSQPSPGGCAAGGGREGG